MITDAGPAPGTFPDAHDEESAIQCESDRCGDD
jgi:hypothetical protein